MDEDQDLEEEETTYGLYVEQDDLETVKEWFEKIREERIIEAEKLEDELEEAETDIQNFLEELEYVRSWKAKKHLETMNGQINEKQMEIERYHRMLRDKRDFIKRRLRDLVKQDREDLDWIWKLERNQREASKEYRPTTKEQIRAANWKARNKGN